MTEVSPGDPKNQVNFASSARPAAGLDVQDDRADDRDLRRASALRRPISPRRSNTTRPRPARATRIRRRHGARRPTTTPTSARRRSRTERCALTTPSTRGCRSTSARRTSRDIAYRLGVRTDLRTSDGAYVPSMGLGSRVVTPLDMASVYSTLAAGGVYSKPMAIRKVDPARRQGRQGGRLGRAAAQARGPGLGRRRGVGILRENMTGGTGVGAYFGQHAGRKDRDDRQFRRRLVLRLLPGLEATIWLGYPKGEIPMTSVHGIAVSGPTVPGDDLEALHGAGD